MKSLTFTENQDIQYDYGPSGITKGSKILKCSVQGVLERRAHEHLVGSVLWLSDFIEVDLNLVLRRVS